MRYLFILFIVLAAGILFLQLQDQQRSGALPVFLRTDPLALQHQTKIHLQTNHPIYQPDSFQLVKLAADYSAIWAHLNHLYATNDIETGKEYYTEDWFRQLARHYEMPQQAAVTRTDLQHELHIENWCWDGLVCTAIDSNLVLQYNYPDKSFRKTKATVAVALLYQGDHWRIDAMRVLSETPL
jgi:hypothetical protein